jgi:hypothetical protein
VNADTLAAECLRLHTLLKLVRAQSDEEGSGTTVREACSELLTRAVNAITLAAAGPVEQGAMIGSTGLTLEDAASVIRDLVVLSQVCLSLFWCRYYCNHADR